MNRVFSIVTFGLALWFSSPAGADTFDCDVFSPPIPISVTSGAPTVTVITIATAETVVDVDVSVDITHDFIGDLTIDLISPAGTSVRVHDEGGSSDANILITFDDQGIPNGSALFNSGCRMRPSGPGSLGDFAGESTLGGWSLSTLDTFNTSLDPGRVLNGWCLSTFDGAVSSPVLPVTGLLCTSPGGTGVVNAVWTNTQTYDAINIQLGGIVIDTIAGGATTYSTTPQPFGVVAELCIEPVIGGIVPCFPECARITPQFLTPDIHECSIPVATIGTSLPPVVDVINVTTDISLADLQVQIDVTHAFLGDLNIDIAHGGTSVTLLQGNTAGAANGVEVTYWDLGVPTGSYDCGCLLQPAGPGSLSDFFGQSSLGPWTLTVTDVGSPPAGVVNIGEVTSWCIRGFETGSVNQLTCNTTSGSGVAQINWANPQTFDSINVYLDGLLAATIPGTATTYQTQPQLIPSTVLVCLEPVLGGIVQAQNCCQANFLVEPVTIDNCSSTSGSGAATIDWTLPAPYDQIQVIVNGTLEATLAGNATTYTTLAAGPLPLTANVCIVGLQGGVSSAQACCAVPLLGVVDYENCRQPNSSFTFGSQASDLMIVPSNLLIGELEVLVEVTHPFIGDLNIDLQGPNATTVRLQAEDPAGSTEGHMLVVYMDTGLPNAAPFDCGCLLQPTGPGTLADFQNIPALGGWTLTVADIYATSGNVGTLNKWCLRITAACQILPPSGVAVSSNGTDAAITWSNPAPYDSIEVVRDGLLVGAIPGTATSYLDVGPTPGVHDYEVFGVDSTLGCSNSGPAVRAGIGITDLVFAGDAGGDIDSPTAILDALTTLGRVPMSIDTFTAASVESAGPFEVIWVCLGTYPNEYELTLPQGVLLAELHTGDVGLDGSIENPKIPVYLESGDHWAFDDETAFQDYDGVENNSFGNLFDGDDSLTQLTGVDTGLGIELAAFSAMYQQDNSSGADFNDWLIPCNVNPDLGGNQATVTWIGMDLFGVPYNVGVFYASTVAPVLTQSWEFGGYLGDHTSLMGEYLAVLGTAPPPPGDQFRRGDVNDDNTVNIADAVFTLGVLFPQPGVTPTFPCADSADGNDDGTLNIADAVFELSVLFPQPGMTPTFPAPSVSCGLDPTPDGLDCAQHNFCP